MFVTNGKRFCNRLTSSSLSGSMTKPSVKTLSQIAHFMGSLISSLANHTAFNQTHLFGMNGTSGFTLYFEEHKHEAHVVRSPFRVFNYSLITNVTLSTADSQIFLMPRLPRSYVMLISFRSSRTRTCSLM